MDHPKTTCAHDSFYSGMVTKDIYDFLKITVKRETKKRTIGHNYQWTQLPGPLDLDMLYIGTPQIYRLFCLFKKIGKHSDLSITALEHFMMERGTQLTA